ncbi:hypothetical protein HID58_033754 [Brassica napus]|uniref:Uncharacterized protein n=1 Tax=Brassica napus TaxID=3708 RepID=A0ABQ8C1E9_BRANA|nr:hypothetical protein HID58_033754 [Brassica napus]
MESGRCSLKVEVRFDAILEARYVRRGGEMIISVDMLLIDWKGTLMPATVNARCVPTFRPHLTAGVMYSIAGFDVVRCNPNFRLSDSSLLVRFSDATSLNEFTEPNIIGEITAMKSTVSDPPEEKNRDGRLYLNATSGTHIYFDKDTNVEESYFYKLVSIDTGLPSADPLWLVVWEHN